MTQFTYEIKDQFGIHARPAGLLVKTAEKFNSQITLVKETKEADAKKLFGVMGLGVKVDDKITVKIDGDDEENAKEALLSFFQENL